MDFEAPPECIAKPLSSDMHFGSGLRMEPRDQDFVSSSWGLDRGRVALASRMSNAIDDACAPSSSPFMPKPTSAGNTSSFQSSLTEHQRHSNTIPRSAQKVSFAMPSDSSALQSALHGSSSRGCAGDGENAEPNAQYAMGVQASPIRISRASLGGLSSSFSRGPCPKTPLYAADRQPASSSTPARALVSFAESPMSVEATPSADTRGTGGGCGLGTPTACSTYGHNSTPFSLKLGLGGAANGENSMNASFMSRFDGDADCATQLLQEAYDLGEHATSE